MCCSNIPARALRACRHGSSDPVSQSVGQICLPDESRTSLLGAGRRLPTMVHIHQTYTPLPKILSRSVQKIAMLKAHTDEPALACSGTNARSHRQQNRGSRANGQFWQRCTRRWSLGSQHSSDDLGILLQAQMIRLSPFLSIPLEPLTSRKWPSNHSGRKSTSPLFPTRLRAISHPLLSQLPIDVPFPKMPSSLLGHSSSILQIWQITSSQQMAAGAASNAYRL